MNRFENEEVKKTMNMEYFFVIHCDELTKGHEI